MANQHLDTPWTDDKVAELKRLWAASYSASAIASELGGVTRNAVIGKISRLRLSRHKPSEFKPGPPRPRRPRRRPVLIAPPPSAPAPAPPEPKKKPHMRRLQLVQLADHHCRWPYGDPHGHPFYFCAADRELGDAYCAFHMAKAFVKSRTR